MGFWVYIPECVDKSYYVGHTSDLEKRLDEHEHNIVKCYTSNRLPVKLKYCCEFPTRDDAWARERQIKGWTHRKKQALISENWDALVKHSKSKSPSTGSG